MENKQAYQEKMEAQLENLQTQIDELKVKANLASKDAKDTYNEQLKTLNHKCSAARTKLEEMKSNGSNAWEDLRNGFENAWNELQDSFNRAKTNFN